MKKVFFFALALAALVSCNNSRKPDLVPAGNFADTLDGSPVALYTLKNGKVTMQVTNFGGRVVSLFTPDRKGRLADIVVGHNTLEEYVNPKGERFLGACVGPVANRIGHAEFKIGDTTYTVSANDHDINTLHGGFKGLDKVVWNVKQVNDTSIVLTYQHKDGQEGFPGNLDMEMTYSLVPGNGFEINYSAKTDHVTPVNISHHPFFNLEGEGSGSVEKYIMFINASHYTPIDSLSIPTGEIAEVEGTPFDFRKPHAIGEMINEDNRQLKNAHGYDHNWCLDRDSTSGPLQLACTVYDKDSGRFIAVMTDQPGLQFYSGNFFDGSSAGKNGKALGFRSSLALETQHYPDSPNHANFPSILLYPGQVYHHTCLYRFLTK
ncbi:MAG: galactose mutarotase [Bacteroidales bacterium]|jgi:aldose 1-epimerase|nr:galactose mutarotase [Bacteroidales bacterium]MCI1785530.1 galactose mutarotase [Bacteroidales bacterium]